ncbi:MAG: hypothetical protein ACJ78Q_08945 [Chloroflexia bacterium]
MRRSLARALSARWPFLVALCLGVLAASVVFLRLPATITGRGTWAIPAIVAVSVVALAMLLLRQSPLLDQPPDTAPAGKDAALQTAIKAAYWCLPVIALAWLLLIPFLGPAAALQTAAGLPALLAPGFLLSLLLLPEQQGVVGRLVLTGALSACVIPMTAAALNFIGIPFSPAVALASVVVPALLLALAILLAPRIGDALKPRGR